MKKVIVPVFFLCLSALSVAQTSLANISTWAYQLQNVNVNTIAANSTFQLVVTDYSYDGSDAMKLTPGDVALVKSSGKKHISYISIGEAENYRSYWQSSWTANPPAWLGAENPNWPGNYKVKYWDPAWQSIVFNYIDTIAAQGFDGVYLDIIDAWYYWQNEVPQAQQVSNADSLMIDFVLRIRAHVNAVTGNSNFIIMPQNGEDLIFQPNISGNLQNQYYSAINALGIEDVFFTGPNAMDNLYAPDNYRLNNLSQYQARGKKVFSIEYLSQSAKIQQYKDTANYRQFAPYTCTRALDQLCDGIALGIEEESAINPVVFPNPAENSIYIACNECDATATFLLIDCEGRTTRLFPYEPKAGEMYYRFEIPIDTPNGMYLLAPEQNISKAHRFILLR